MKKVLVILVFIFASIACSSPMKHIGTKTGTDTTIEADVHVGVIAPDTDSARPADAGTGVAADTGTGTIVTTAAADAMPTVPECKTQLTVTTEKLSDDERRITSTSEDAQKQVLIRGSISSGCNAKYIGRMTISITNVQVSLVLCELHIGGMVFYPFVPSYPESVMFVFKEAVVVAAGMSMGFEIIAQTYSASRGATITTNILSDDGESQNFLWSDKTADVHSLKSSDWRNGYGVSGLSTAEQVLINVD